MSSLFCFSTSQTKTSKVRKRVNLISVLLIGCVVEEGDRIAQLIIERIYTPDVMEVDVRLAYSRS